MGALDGIRVLDLSRLLPGPFCSTILGDHGASVIVVEAPRFRERSVIGSVPMVRRNKRHLALNLREEEGREIFMSLAAISDVVLEAFRPGVVCDLGVDYSAVQKINPGIIYCSLSGYGQTGPLSGKAVHDLNCVAYAGILDLFRDPEGNPVEPGVPLAGLTGSLYAAIGILLALVSRHATGKGQFIDTSMCDGLVSFLALPLSALRNSSRLPEGRGSARRPPAPYYRAYRTMDGRHITLGALEGHLWEHFCHKVGCPEYIDKQHDHEFADVISRHLETIFGARKFQEWVDLFDEDDDCVAPVLSGPELSKQAHIQSRGMIRLNPDGVSEPGIPIKLSETPGNIRRPAYRFGEHSQEILRELGYSEPAIRGLVAEHIVWCAEDSE
jgi:crotonobetainyl-CoA:carnitine CoA-transferase CaiB-like acyl-CoA transferase